MAEEGAEDRTEAPSEQRIRRAREEGTVALSREGVSFAALASASLAGMLILPASGMELVRHLAATLQAAHALEWQPAATDMLWLLLRVVAPIAGAAALAASAATLLQTGLLVSARGLKPGLSRLNPLSGLRRIVGPDHLQEVARTLLKLALVAASLWHAAGDPLALRGAFQMQAAALMGSLGELARRLLTAALAAFCVLALFDVLLVRLRHMRRLRMSREELRQEMRESEGDPQLKARLRRLRLGRARKRMLAAVPKAAVVVTNPTHYAVALAYEQGKTAAPRVVAKGVDALAARIRAAAEEHGVPLVANPPLARALYKLEPDTEIPAEHYQAVAEIIAFVWRIRSRAQARPA